VRVLFKINFHKYQISNYLNIFANIINILSIKII
jgi:hypothetical protein